MTKTSGRGESPGPPNDIRAPQGGRPAWPVHGDPDLTAEARPPGVFGGRLGRGRRSWRGLRPSVPFI